MTLLKKVLNASTKDAERRLVVQDHCVMMHRFDKAHVSHYKIVISDVHKEQTELTLKQYLESEAGAIWSSPRVCAVAQHYIRFLALQRLAHFENVQRIQQQRKYMSPDDAESVKPYVEAIRHALCTINPFQVRIFVAFLFNMCSINDIKSVKRGQKVRDKYAEGDDEATWAEPFEIELRFYHPSNLERHVGAVVHELCYPRLAPASAMSWLTRQLNISRQQCPWTQHISSGLQCPEEAHAEKGSFWHFWEGEERFCPLEQRASQASVERQLKAAKEAVSKLSVDAAPEEETKNSSEERPETQQADPLSVDAAPEEETKNSSEERPETQQVDPLATPVGKPIVPVGKPHSKSSKNRANVRLEFNAGLRQNVGLRYANLSVESINRGTNRFAWRKNGWCAAHSAFVRCDVTMIAANISAMRHSRTQQHVQRTQPELWRALREEIYHCRHLVFLKYLVRQRANRTGLAYDLAIDKAEWDALVNGKVREHMLQFESDLAPPHLVRAARVQQWLTRRPSGWQFSLSALLRCRREQFTEQGRTVDLDTMRMSFVEFGHHLNQTESAAFRLLLIKEQKEESL